MFAIRREKICWGFLLLIASLGVSFPLYSANVRFYDDIPFHLGRILSIAEGLSAGEFPVVMYEYGLAGYGTPTGLFYPDLYMYLPAVLYLGGLELCLTYNIYGILLNIGTVLLSWYAYTLILKNYRYGACAALLYMSTFYRLMEFYAHGGMGTVTALAFFPLVLAGLIDVWRRQAKHWRVLTLGLTGVILSHVISAALIGVGLIIFSLVHIAIGKREAWRLKTAAKALLLTFALTAWFVCPFWQFYSTLDFNIKSGGELAASPIMDRALSPFLFINVECLAGWPLLILTILSALRLGRKKFFGQFVPQKFYLSLILAAALGLWMCTQFFPWHIAEPLPLIGYLFKTIQFPWRVACLIVTILPVVAAWWISETIGARWGAVVCVGAALFNLVYIYTDPLATNGPSWFAPRRPLVAYAEEPGLKNTWSGSNDYLYAGVKFHALRNREGEPLDGSEFYGAARISDIQRRGSTLIFSYENFTDEVATEQLPRFYFPGYLAKLENGEKLDLSESVEHYLQVNLPPGSHTAVLRYVGTSVARISFWLSLLSWLLFLLFTVFLGTLSPNPCKGK